MSDFVTFEGVEAINRYGLTLLCRVDGKKAWVPHTPVREPRDGGRLTLPLWVALKLGLVQRAA